VDFEHAAVLLTSELVTNALLHARSAPELHVRLADGRLRVGVTDATPTAPVRKRYGKEAATGRGLLLIETMASSWGTEALDGGKVVWFELGPEAAFDADLVTRTEVGDASAADGSGTRPGHRAGSASPDHRPSAGPRASDRRARSRLHRTVRP